MSADQAPEAIRALADRRAAARRARDWVTADALRAEIEAAGWRVIDAASLYTLERDVPPDEVTDGITRYGSSLTVPSRLDDGPVGLASLVLPASGWPTDLDRTLTALARALPDGVQVIVVDRGSTPPDLAIGGQQPEIVRTSAELGHAAALNAGIRRAAAAVVILLDTSVEPIGDLVTPLVTALGDPGVAVAGPFGLLSDDLRRFEEPAAGTVDVVAIEGYVQAFRRADYVERGPLDEHFAFYRNLDIWWSLVLRDPLSAAHGPDEDGVFDARGRPVLPTARRAVCVGRDLVRRHEHRGWTSLPEAERDRLSKRNFYRVLKRFASRHDLLVPPR